MRIGFAYDIKIPGEALAEGIPEDQYEEYDPPETIDAIASALTEHGHELVRLGGGRDFLESILESHPDFVFSISEGRGNYRSREGQVPSVLEMLGIPYTFSDPLTLAISLDKPLCKKLAEEAGVAIPAGWVISSESEIYHLEELKLDYPLFVKPAFEGSSKGIHGNSRVHNLKELKTTAASLLRDYMQPALVESFVEGDEYTVGIIGNEPPEVIGAMRIRPRSGADPEFAYTLDVKRDWQNLVAYDVPAPLSPETYKRLSQDAVAVFRAVGCRDAARVDFRVKDGIPFFLEINPLPGLSPVYSDLSLLASGMGMTHYELIGRILDAAFIRCGIREKK